jgi:predicted flap endonuclease-1-like 5' DNA nuclease
MEVDMNLLAALVLGLLIGWVIEWVIDWFYWRGRIVNAAREHASLRERITVLEEENRKRPVFTGAKTKSTFLTDKDGNDNFQAIKGIGPAFSKRLHEAGIQTFEQLSQLTPQQMEEILGLLFKRFFAKENSILAHARELAEIKANTK